MNARTDTRERILTRAESLLSRRGFNGFSYQDIATALGIKNAAVHYHFPAKADLGLALINNYRDLLRRGTETFMKSGGSATRQLEGYFHFTAHDQLGEGVCPIGATTADFGSLNDTMKEALQELVTETVRWLTHVLEVGRKQGEFEFEGDPAHKALSLMASVQGARQLARVLGRPGAVRETTEQVRIDLGMKK